jgi:ribosomal protein S18 acetylase RimI-like enzyme
MSVSFAVGAVMRAHSYGCCAVTCLLRRVPVTKPTVGGDNAIMPEPVKPNAPDVNTSVSWTVKPGALPWRLRPARVADIEQVAELRATVLRTDLERLGRFDEHRVRQRLRDSFSLPHTSIIEISDELAGSITLRPAEDGYWLEHFYLAPAYQGRGLGSSVLRTILRRIDASRANVRLNVLAGSAAQRLYERHGFTVEHQDPVDVYLVRPRMDII